jgi:hypothetical protein
MNRNGTYYLNNHGSAWVILENGKRVKVRILPDNYSPCTEPIVRTHIKFESFGNFASVSYKYKGKIYSSLNYDFETDQTP